MTYPILEFDPAREAYIEPAQVISPRDMPEHCVLCFFREVIDQVVHEHKAAKIAENLWEDGPHTVYEIQYRNNRLALIHPGVGAPTAAAFLEELIALGCRKFIACGGCGALTSDIAVGNLIVVTGAIRDEGVSYHYLPPEREVIANKVGVKALITTLNEQGVPYRTGKTWTTDAPYRETSARISKRREDGCLTVEMESASMMAVAQFRKVVFGQVLYGGDDLSGHEWNDRRWQTRNEIRTKLFWLSADACLAIDSEVKRSTG